MQEFEPHGDYRIEIDGRIVKVAVGETANRELMQAYTREMSARIAAFGGEPFGHYLEYLSDVLLIDEALEPLQASIAERKSKGLCAVAINLSRTTAPSVISAQISSVYEAAGLPWKQVEDFPGARSWLSERIRAAGGK